MTQNVPDWVTLKVGRRVVDRGYSPLGGCWITPYTPKAKSPHVVVASGGRKWTVQVQRAAYTVLVGPISPQDQLRSRCHNPHCINPDHLYVVGASSEEDRLREAEFLLEGGRTWPEIERALAWSLSTIERKAEAHGFEWLGAQARHERGAREEYGVA